MCKLFVFLAISCIIANVCANDLQLGVISYNSRKIYSERRTLNPAIWKRSEELTISTEGHEVISAIEVFDLRENKDGEAEIQSGGVGSQTVTIELKSPAVFRGYDFQVNVYATNPNARLQGKGSEYRNMYGNYQEIQSQPYPAKI